MHIGFIEDTLLRGGTQIWVVEAVRNFLGKKEDVTVLAPEGSFVAVECGRAGARTETYDWEKIAGRDDAFKKAWIRGLAPCDVAVCTVHPPRNGFHCSVFAAECIKEAGLETILMPKTGTIVPEYLREFYVPGESINSTVICITEFTRNYLLNEYNIPPAMVELIYQGTEIDRFTLTPEIMAEARMRYELPEKASPVLGYAGSFEERKGQIILLQAVEKLAESDLPDIHAILAGDGPDEKMLKAKVKEMGLEGHISFFPFTSEPNYVFARIDIFALPSLYKEGLPNVLLEAMSMGLPVVASEIAGIPEIVFNGKTGYMVPPGDSGRFAEAVVKIWRDKEVYEQIKTDARKLMEERFNKEVQFDAFLDYFRRHAGKRARRGVF